MTSGDAPEPPLLHCRVSAVGGGLVLSLRPAVRARAHCRRSTGSHRLAAHRLRIIPSSSALRAPRWARGCRPGSRCWSPRSSNATGRMSAPNSSTPKENMRREGVWGDMSTGASRSIASSQLYLRQAGAMAREMLIAGAAARWNVPPSECAAAMSVITHQPSGRTLTFGAVAEAAAKVPPPADVKLKNPANGSLPASPAGALTCSIKSPPSRSMQSTCGCRECSTRPSRIARYWWRAEGGQ